MYDHGLAIKAVMCEATARMQQDAKARYLLVAADATGAAMSAQRAAEGLAARLHRLLVYLTGDVLRELLVGGAQDLFRAFSRARTPDVSSTDAGRDSRRLYPGSGPPLDTMLPAPQPPRHASVIYLEACLAAAEPRPLVVSPSGAELAAGLAQVLAEMTSAATSGLSMLLHVQTPAAAAGAGSAAEDDGAAMQPAVDELGCRLQADAEMRHLTASLQQRAMDIVAVATAALPTWEPLRVLHQNAMEFLASAATAEPSEPFFRAGLWRFRREIDDLAAVVVETTQGAAHLSCFRLRQLQVLPVLQDCVATLHRRLPLYLDTQLDVLLTFIDRTTRDLHVMPTVLTDVAAFLANLSAAEAQEPSMDSLYVCPTVCLQFMPIFAACVYRWGSLVPATGSR